MASYRIYNARLASLRSMRRVTKTMKMVSATKLRRAQAAEERATRFSGRMGDVAGHVLALPEARAHEFVLPRAPVRNGLLIVLSADKGLCGGFNANLVRFAAQWIEEQRARFHKLRAAFCGRRALAALRDRVEVRNVYDGVAARPDFRAALRIGRDVTDAFAARQYDEVHLAYNRFHSAMSQEPVIERLLPVPLDTAAAPAAPGPRAEHLFEPEAPRLIELFLRQLVCLRLHSALLQNAAGEHGARMTAMDSATSNVDNLTLRYTKLRNQARQSSITGELIEIISGAEALK
ncbi:MAG TPA: ATP synthase F1 subunit gamma [Kiritimatiellia bacterium]|nr:ATP synthase F1 subunit gamma [Kiritimatiellia bacterium]HRZ11011.1 ATP synthase F1 subunit gamma [Kiritimatiellia bacterium]HSA18584.1 ATP synthase F1 subunit gamma [Kiritimatiellia bacterium]